MDNNKSPPTKIIHTAGMDKLQTLSEAIKMIYTTKTLFCLHLKFKTKNIN